MCTQEVQTPFQTFFDLLVAILVAGSYIQQLILTANHDSRGNGAISGWYIILMTVSASSHLAARIENCYSYWAYNCVRTGELKGCDAFSALVVFLQPLAHWVGATTLMAVYVAFRTRDTPLISPRDIKNGSGTTTKTTMSPMTEYPVTSPSNQVILAITLTHAAIVLPIAIILLVHFEDN
ncbi:uncharacterized protein BJX67DRAFT_386017 [Aspergillus lucknowensis]|uniref:Uncharacterized protein n=1 Tax=Aspergillus lucknowensis TaxID=176173 RepID=A0ABR4L975_9EURO